MVKKQGLLGRTWDRLRDQQKLGVIALLVANILLPMLGFVPQFGVAILACVYSTELIIFIVTGFMLLFTEGEW